MIKKSPNPTDVHVGNRVRLRRMMLSMSQEKLGHALGLTFQQVQKYEKGTNRIGASRLQQIATALQVPVAWFFEGTEQQHLVVEDPGAELCRTRDGLALARAFNAITDSASRAAILSVAEASAEANRNAAKRAA